MTKPRKPTIADDALFAQPGAAPGRGTPIEELPRDIPTGSQAPISDASESPAKSKTQPKPAGGIKEATKGITLYLLPEEHRRLKMLAVSLDVNLHEIALLGLDRLLAEHGQPPVRRYRPAEK